MKLSHSIIAISIIFILFSSILYSEDNAPKRWWNGGIGITFGNPPKTIPDITELGYELKWGGRADPDSICLGAKSFKYWNGIVEISLKNEKIGYDFTSVKDKQKACKLAFDAWAKYEYGKDNLSKYTTLEYRPKANYGDVFGKMDLETDNELVKAISETFDKLLGGNNGYCGIAIDNSLKTPACFLKRLKGVTSRNNSVIVLNTTPKNLSKEKLKYIDLAGGEHFPYNNKTVSALRQKGFNGYFCEFTKQHLNASELTSYLLTKQLNGVIFFGYMGKYSAAGNSYSSYKRRPDVYNHQRWIFRKYIPLVKNILELEKQAKISATLTLNNIAKATSKPKDISTDIKSTGEGKIIEETEQGVKGFFNITGISPDTKSYIHQYCNDISKGIYFVAYSSDEGVITFNKREYNIRPEMIVYDEIKENKANFTISRNDISINIGKGISVFQIGSPETIVKNLHKRIMYTLNQQDKQKAFIDKVGKIGLDGSAWTNFVYRKNELSDVEALSGSRSFYAKGGLRYSANNKFKYFLRTGTAQLVNVNQKTPEPLILTAHSKCKGVKQVVDINLNSMKERRLHLNNREAYTYAIHLYLDYRDGSWPEVYSQSFSPGTHGWQKVEKVVYPKKDLKTAMVLIEYHQPEGEAWFDNISLSLKSEPEANLLGNGGFEPVDSEKADWENNIYRKYYNNMKSTINSSSKINVATIEKANSSVEFLKDWIETENRMPYYARQWRDIIDIQKYYNISKKVLSGK